MQRANPEQMAKWLARRAQYGWDWTETSRRSGEPAWKLRWWQQRFERTRAAERRGHAFVAVELTDPAPSPRAVLEVTTPTGYRVEVPAGFDPEHLHRLLRALADRC